MATVRWRGDAQGKAQIELWTIALAAIGVKVTATVNGKDIAYSLLQTDVTTAVAADASATKSQVAMNKLLALIGATTIREFAENSYAVDLDGNGRTEGITVTGDSSGIPYTISLAASANVVVDLIQEGTAALNEIQQVSLGSPTGGTFTLTYSGQTTSAIAYNASAATVDAALEALSNIGVGDVTVTGSAGGPYTIEFTGALALTDVPLIYGSAAGLTGCGTTFTSRTLQSPTGPNWWSEAENWDTGSVPVTDDVVIIADSAVPVRYGLGQSAVSLEALHIRSANVGLPRLNPSGYIEYRDLELAIGVNGTGAAASQLVVVDGSTITLARLNTGTKQTVLNVLSTGNSLVNGEQALQWRGTHASNTIDIRQGSLGVATKYGVPATVASLLVGYVRSVDADSIVVVGDAVTLAAVKKTGGDLRMQSGAGSFDHRAGQSSLDGSGDFTSVDVSGGIVYSQTTGVIGGYGAITGITAADPAVVSSTAHGLSDGDKIRIAGVVGMTEVNQQEYAVEVASANSFSLVGVNSSAFTAYSSGGNWGKIGSVIVSGQGALDFSRSSATRQVATDIYLYGGEAKVLDENDAMTTLTRLTGQFGVRQFGGARFGTLGGRTSSWIRQV